MSEGARANNGAVLVAVFSWATGLLAGVLVAAIYFRSHEPPPAPAPDVQILRTPWPAPTPTPDCPAHAIWSTCEPMPKTGEGIERAITSGAVGWLDIEVKVAGGWNSTKVDGIQYPNLVAPCCRRRNPIIPGLHELEMFDLQKMRYLKCNFLITKGRLSRVVFDAKGQCGVEEGDVPPIGVQPATG